MVQLSHPGTDRHAGNRWQAFASMLLLACLAFFLAANRSESAQQQWFHEEQGIRPVHGRTGSLHGGTVFSIQNGQAAREAARPLLLAEDRVRDREMDGPVGDYGPELAEEWGGLLIPDPLEPLNRVFFEFNDRLYFWILKPVGTGYAYVVPLTARVSIRNFFTNLIMPIRAVNCLLQGKFEGFGIELARFMVNTTVGFLGFQDVARHALDMPLQQEDLGQTLAVYGIGPGLYLNLPFLGPSTLRGFAGWFGDLYLNPLDYLVRDFWPNVGVRTIDLTNNASLRIGDYEAMKAAALDPYEAMKDAFWQYRLKQIAE